MFNVVQGWRQEGKTRYCLEWLLEGRRTPAKPYWSRVVVVPTSGQVGSTQYMLSGMLAMRPQIAEADHDVLRKAIWPWELYRRSYGYQWKDSLDFCFDNFDQLVADLFSVSLKLPVFVTSTAEWHVQDLGGGSHVLVRRTE